jgi:hypothetical protein
MSHRKNVFATLVAGSALTLTSVSGVLLASVPCPNTMDTGVISCPYAQVGNPCAGRPAADCTTSQEVIFTWDGRFETVTYEAGPPEKNPAAKDKRADFSSNKACYLTAECVVLSTGACGKSGTQEVVNKPTYVTVACVKPSGGG